MRQSLVRRARNRAINSAVKTYVRKAERQITTGDAAGETEASVHEALRQLDKAVTKGVLHKNNAARRKSRLMHKLNATKAPGA
jgi:small subunit ribosomal protein S20